jgi:hypothetical protein
MDETEINQSAKIFVSAITCQEVLIEQSGIPSAFRLADRIETAPLTFTRNLPNGDPDPNGLHAVFSPAELRAIITFHSEQATRFVLNVKQKRPDGRHGDASSSKDMEIPEPGRGVMLNTTIAVATAYEGVHWLEFWINGQLANKTPVTIIHPPELKNHRKWTAEEWTKHFLEISHQQPQVEAETN